MTALGTKSVQGWLKRRVERNVSGPSAAARDASDTHVWGEASDALGNRVALRAQCPCQRQQDAERKARFDKTRPNSSARGYTRKWEGARAAYLKVHRHCRRCGCMAQVVDHIVPHKPFVPRKIIGN